jgi:translin
MNLDEIAGEIQDVLDEKEAVREVVLKSSRAIVRQCCSVIQSIHRGEDTSAGFRGLRRDMEKLRSVLSGHPEMDNSGFVETAYQEFTEVSILHALVGDRTMPGHRELSVTPQAYLEGVGDVVGEVRRLALAATMDGDIDNARKWLCTMETLYDFLMRFDYPSALAGVKRKQDVARSLVEKTRGEVAVASRACSLERRLGELEDRVPR